MDAFNYLSVLLREQVDERGVNLREHYHRQAPWFFGFFVATLIVSFAKEVVLMGRARAVPRAGIGAYIALLFTRLR